MPIQKHSPGDPRDGLETAANALELFLRASLIAIGVAIFGFAILIIATMEAGSKSQGGRWYVAVGAMVALGAIDTQYGRLVRRRLPFDLFGFSQQWMRYGLKSMLLLCLAGLVLFLCAWLIP